MLTDHTKHLRAELNRVLHISNLYQNAIAELVDTLQQHKQQGVDQISTKAIINILDKHLVPQDKKE